MLYRHRRRLPLDVQWLLADQVRALRTARSMRGEERDATRIIELGDALAADVERTMPWAQKSGGREYAESIIIALAIALFIRAFLFEAFKIPTGSMIPTLLVGDHIFVGKFIYGLKVPFTGTHILRLRQPRRGEVIVFEYPWGGRDEGKDFIKRVQAVPGDRIRLESNVWYVNGERGESTRVIARKTPCMLPPGERCKWRDAVSKDGGPLISQPEHPGCPCTYLEEADNGYTWISQHQWPEAICSCRSPSEPRSAAMNRGDWPATGAATSYLAGWGPHPKQGVRWRRRLADGRVEMEVPPGYVFVAGDNRDNSHDGRVWGLVPLDKIKGKALMLWWAAADRRGRLFRSVH